MGFDAVRDEGFSLDAHAIPTATPSVIRAAQKTPPTLLLLLLRHRETGYSAARVRNRTGGSVATRWMVRETRTAASDIAARAVRLAVLAAAVGTFVALGALVPATGGFGWDERIAAAVADTAPVSSSEVHADPVLTAITVAVGAVTLLVTLGLLLRVRTRAALLLLLAIGGTVALSAAAKGIVQRPPIEGDPAEYTFPSGSAAWSLATAMSLVLLTHKGTARRLVLAVAAMFVLGFAWVIIWEEWHYPSDVVAGWCLALAWVGALWAILRPRDGTGLT